MTPDPPSSPALRELLDRWRAKEAQWRFHGRVDAPDTLKQCIIELSAALASAPPVREASSLIAPLERLVKQWLASAEATM